MTATATVHSNHKDAISAAFQWAPPLRVRYLRELWRRVGLQSLAADKPIAIYGGGRHTRFLLNVIADVEPAPRIAAILDDGAQPDTQIAGIPVRKPAEFDPSSVVVVVLSSDTIEAKLAATAAAWIARSSKGSGSRPEVLRLYEGLPPGPYELPNPYPGTYGSVASERNGHLPMQPGSLVLRLEHVPPPVTSGALPIPPAELRAGYHPFSDKGYLQTGVDDVAVIRSMIRDNLGEPALTKVRRVLDWGCSSGRMLRHWSEFLCDLPGAERGEAWGCDICANSINWAQENLSPPLKFFQSTLRPHLPVEDNSFDLVYGNSVFTHIRELHDSWLMELRRVLRPGGLLWLSVHEETSWDLCGTAPDGALTRRCAELDFTRPMDADFVSYGHGFDPVTFWHSKGIRRRWSFAFDVLEIRPQQIRQQAGVLLRKPSR